MESFKYYNKHPEERMNIPEELRKYLRTIRIMQFATPFIVLLMIILNGSSNTFLNILSLIVMGVVIELMLEIYYRSMSGKFMLHEYIETIGKIIEVKQTKIERSGTKIQILIETPEKEYYNIYLKGGIFSSTSLSQEGMEVKIFMPEDLRENQGIYIVNDYYSIEVYS